MHGNEKLLIPFAIYGFIAGLIMVINGMWYGQETLRQITNLMNYPTIVSFMLIFGEGFAIPIPLPIWDIIKILWSIALWTVFGFLSFRAYKWLAYIPPDE